MQISILNAGGPTDYLYGLVAGLSSQPEMQIEVVDGDVSQHLFDHSSNVRHFNLRGDNRSPQSLFTKIFRIFFYYLRLMLYAAQTRSQVFHIQWDNSFLMFDRTLLLLYYKMCGKKIVYTAHNISKEARDGVDTWYHRTSLKSLYRLADATIVHTESMKEELIAAFHVPSDKIYVVRHGINLLVPRTGMTKIEARQKLDLPATAHVILFFGYISKYKGVDLLIDAVSRMANDDPAATLVIAGQFKCTSAFRTSIEIRLAQLQTRISVKTFFQFIPPEQVEELFVAADCVALPYRAIYQSGIIFLAYRFGIPLVATDVGSFREDIIDGKTGILCERDNVISLSEAFQKYFSSPLFLHQNQTRIDIARWAEERYSWGQIGKQTADIYAKLLHRP